MAVRWQGVARLAVQSEADHLAVTALMDQEIEHVDRTNIDRCLRHHRQERRQIERRRPQRVGHTKSNASVLSAIQ